MESGAGEKGLRKGDLLLVGALVVLALAIRVYFHQFFRVISADGVGYVGAARSFANGEGLGASLVYGTVYPGLTALVSFLTGDFEVAGRTVSMVMGSLLVVPVFLLGTEFFSKRAGLIAALLCIVWPSLRMWSGEVMTQATYITLALTAVYLLWRAAVGGSRTLSVAAGAVFGLTYLTRPECLVLVVALLGALLCRSLLLKEGMRRTVVVTLCAGGGFLLLFLPYLCFVHASTGSWQVTGKMGNTLADALSDYLGRPDLKREPGFQGIGIMDVIRNYPRFLPLNFMKNARETWSTMVPLYLWVVAFVGFIWSGRGVEGWSRRIYLLATFAPLLVIVTFFFVGPEYLQPYLPVLFLFAGHGVCRLEERIAAFFPSAPLARLAQRHYGLSVGVCATVVLACVTIYAQVPADRNKPYSFMDDGGRFDHKRIGLLLKARLPKGSKIMTRWGRISFYAELDRVDMPQASLGEIVQAARQAGVRYMVVDGMLSGVRPQLGPLLEPVFVGPPQLDIAPGQVDYRPIPGMRLYLLHKDPSSMGVAVYEFL